MTVVTPVKHLDIERAWISHVVLDAGWQKMVPAILQMTSSGSPALLPEPGEWLLAVMR
jgi:hypothetical protein